MRCENCKTNEAVNNVCNGDGGLHYHGRIHTHPKFNNSNSTNLLALCRICADLDKKFWDESHKEKTNS